MKRLAWLFAVTSVLILHSGCSNDEAASSAPESETMASQATAADDTADSHDHEADERASVESDQPPTSAASPDGVVGQFLQALEDGDNGTAESLLTLRAREETSRHDLAVRAPGTAGTSFEIGEVEFANEERDAAYVSSVWQGEFEAGSFEAHEIIWVLRHETDGWRIAGMATRMDENEPPVFLNFEEPEEMIQRWQEADAEFARRESTPPTRTAEQPQDPVRR